MKYFTGFKLLFGVMLIVGLVGCATYPLGMSVQEWNALTPQQQIDARAEQAKLNELAAQRRAEQARLKAEQEAREQAELERRKANAAYGERVQCVLDSAEYKNGKSWFAIEPVGFDLVIGEVQELTLVHYKNQSSRYTRNSYASFDGQTVSICRYKGGHASSNCLKMTGTTQEYHRGLKARMQRSDYLRGHLRCNLKTNYPIAPMRPYR